MSNNRIPSGPKAGLPATGPATPKSALHTSTVAAPVASGPLSQFRLASPLAQKQVERTLLASLGRDTLEAIQHAKNHVGLRKETRVFLDSLSPQTIYTVGHELGLITSLRYCLTILNSTAEKEALKQNLIPQLLEIFSTTHSDHEKFLGKLSSILRDPERKNALLLAVRWCEPQELAVVTPRHPFSILRSDRDFVNFSARYENQAVTIRGRNSGRSYAPDEYTFDIVDEIFPHAHQRGFFRDGIVTQAIPISGNGDRMIRNERDYRVMMGSLGSIRGRRDDRGNFVKFPVSRYEVRIYKSNADLQIYQDEPTPGPGEDCPYILVEFEL